MDKLEYQELLNSLGIVVVSGDGTLTDNGDECIEYQYTDKTWGYIKNFIVGVIKENDSSYLVYGLNEDWYHYKDNVYYMEDIPSIERKGKNRTECLRDVVYAMYHWWLIDHPDDDNLAESLETKKVIPPSPIQPSVPS